MATFAKAVFLFFLFAATLANKGHAERVKRVRIELKKTMFTAGRLEFSRTRRLKIRTILGNVHYEESGGLFSSKTEGWHLDPPAPPKLPSVIQIGSLVANVWGSCGSVDAVIGIGRNQIARARFGFATQHLLVDLQGVSDGLPYSTGTVNEHQWQTLSSFKLAPLQGLVLAGNHDLLGPGLTLTIANDSDF